MHHSRLDDDNDDEDDDERNKVPFAEQRITFSLNHINQWLQLKQKRPILENSTRKSLIQW